MDGLQNQLVMMKLFFIALVTFFACNTKPGANKKLKSSEEVSDTVEIPLHGFNAATQKSNNLSWCNEFTDTMNLMVTLDKIKDTFFISYGVVMFKGTLVYSTSDTVNRSGFFLEKNFKGNAVNVKIKDEYLWQEPVYYDLKLSIDPNDSSMLWQVKSRNINQVFPKKVHLKLCKE